jgi:hypothetical protein
MLWVHAQPLLVLLQEKHPLLQDVMSCFASLLKEYKGEVEEMFVADKLVSPLPSLLHPSGI